MPRPPPFPSFSGCGPVGGGNREKEHPRTWPDDRRIPPDDRHARERESRESRGREWRERTNECRAKGKVGGEKETDGVEVEDVQTKGGRRRRGGRGRKERSEPTAP